MFYLGPLVLVARRFVCHKINDPPPTVLTAVLSFVQPNIKEIQTKALQQ